MVEKPRVVATQGDDDAAGGAVRMLRQGAGDEFVGQPVEAVALDAFGGEGARQGEALGDFRLAAVEGGIETGDLRHVGQQGLQGADAGDVVRLVQRGEGDEAGQVAEYGFIDDGRLRVALAAVHDAMADGDDLPAGVRGHEPLEQGVEGDVMADLFAGDGLVGNLLAGAVFGDHFGGVGADTVDLAGDFGFRGDRVVEREQGELDGRRSGIDRQDGLLHGQVVPFLRLAWAISPSASIIANVIPSTPGAPRFARANRYAWKRMSSRHILS